jgi:hypothetical protein
MSKESDLQAAAECVTSFSLLRQAPNVPGAAIARMPKWCREQLKDLKAEHFQDTREYKGRKGRFNK